MNVTTRLGRGRDVLTVGSMFSGVGLLDYGLHLAGLLHAWFAERDEFRRGILARRWPGALVLDDVRAVCADAVPRVDVIAGGFPCKGASTAGKRTGFDHPETVLWREMRRAVGELRPRYVLVENVANLLTMARAPGEPAGSAWGEVLADLAAFGFDVRWDCLLLRPSAPRTSVTGSSPLLPTPVARDWKGAGYAGQLPTMLALLPTPRASERHTREATIAAGIDRGESLPSAVAKLLPTPAAVEYGNNQQESPGAAVRPALPYLVRALPSRGRMDQQSSGGKPSSGLRLSPWFVEWMIGAPAGWSDPDCPLSATEFKSKQESSADDGS